MILAICGFIGSGKDTVADYLVEQHGFQQVSFAQSLKDSVSAVFGWNRDLLEGRSPESRKWREQVDEWWAERLGMPHLTPRWVLQYWGTEVARGGFHDDIWIAALEKKMSSSTANMVISDCRFPNEVTALKRMGGWLIHVTRGPRPAWYTDAVRACQGDHLSRQRLENQGIHSSEWRWVNSPADYTIANEGTLADLYRSIDQLITEI